MTTNNEKYRRAFETEVSSSKITEMALEHALDIRKFEISLYWQRATYFWALIAAAFAGYFAILAAENGNGREFNAFVVACIGSVFSLAWFLANRGSKFWQENWEQHVDMLEDNVAGPLYKTVLHRPTPTEFVERWVVGPLPISVSKVNQWTSLFIFLVWPVLAWNIAPQFKWDGIPDWKYIGVAALTVLTWIVMAKYSKSGLGGHKTSVLVERTGSIL